MKPSTEFATKLKSMTERYSAVKVKMEAMRQKYDILQRGNQELRDNFMKEKSLRMQEQLKASEMEQKILLHKDLVQKLKEELGKMIHLKQKLHDGEMELLNCQLGATEEKCETVMVQKEVVSQENAALLCQMLELSRKLHVEKSSFIQHQLLTAQNEDQLRDQVDELQLLLQLNTRDNEALQSEIQFLKLKMDPPNKFSVGKLYRRSHYQGERTSPCLCGWLTQLVIHEQQKQAHKTPTIFYLENNRYMKIDSSTVTAGWLSS